MRKGSVIALFVCLFISLLVGFMYAGSKNTVVASDKQTDQVSPGAALEPDNKVVGSNNEIKVEQVIKAKVTKSGMTKKLLFESMQPSIELISIREIDPNIRPSLPYYPPAHSDDKYSLKQMKTWHRPADNLYVKGEMLVQLHNVARNRVEIRVTDGIAMFNIPELDVLNDQYGAYEISRVIEEELPQGKEFGLDLIFLMKVRDDLDLEAVAGEYRLIEVVKEVSPNYLPFKHDADVPPRVIPNDPYYDWSDSVVKGPECWAIPQYGSNSVILSILDIETLYETHEDLSGNYLGVKGGTGSGGDHGTMCASVACARLNNTTGMSGLSGGWNTTQGVLWTGYVFIDAADNIDGITWSIGQGAKILSESIGYFGNPAGLESAFEWAWSQGAIAFASAGNDAASPEPGWPAYYGIVVAVGGCNAAGRLWDWGNGTGSNIGEWVDILGPGDAQYCCSATGYTADYGGTSFATPAVAAAAALILSANPSLTPTEIRARLIRAADCNEHKDPQYAGLMGAGIVDLYESIKIYDTNVSVNEIMGVPASAAEYSTIYPRAIVQNRGAGAASFDVVAQASTPTVVYADTIHITNLMPNNEYEQNFEIVEFDPWLATPGAYTFKVWSVLSGDQNNANDTLSQTVSVVAGAGIDTLIIDSDIPSAYGANGSSGWAEAVQIPIAEPCSVVAILFFPMNVDTTINWRLWEDDGSGNRPNTLVRSGAVQPTSSGDWYRIDLPTKYYVSGGYLYPGWADVSSPFYYNAYDDALADPPFNWWYDGSSWVNDDYFGGDFMIRLVVETPGKNDHDVTAFQVLEPDMHVIPAQPYIPECVVRNLGRYTESFPAYFRVDSAGTPIYSQSVSVSDLPPDVRDTLGYPSWIPDWEGGTYNVKFYTDLTGDENRGNDTVSINILSSSTDTLYFDSGVFRYIAGDSVYLGVRFTAERAVTITGVQFYMYRRRESAQAPACVPCTAFVWDDAGGDPGTQLYSRAQAIPTTVTTGEYVWYSHTLAETVSHPSGDFWVGVWQPGYVGRSGGQGRDSTEEYVMLDAESDVFRSKVSSDKVDWSLYGVDAMIRVIVQYQGSLSDHDVMTSAIDEPGTIVSTLYPYPVKADVKNIGANTETFDVVARINESGGAQVYEQTINASSVQAGEIRGLTFSDWQPVKAQTYYDLTVFTNLAGDLNRNNDTLIQDSIFSTPNSVIAYDNGVGAYYWGDPDYVYTAERFSPESNGWLIGCWVAMYSDVTPWADCSLFVWDDDDGWNDGGLPDPSVVYISGPVSFDPGGIGGYWFYVSFPPVWIDTTSDFFIGLWNAEPPYILMDDTTSTWRSFCAEDPWNDWQPVGYDYMIEAVMRYDFNGAPPKPAYIYAKKNTTKDSVIVYWNAVLEDTLNNPTAIEWYEIYSNTSPSYIPQSGDWLASPSDTFMTEQPAYSVNRHYLNYPVSIYLQAGAKSNMGYALYRFFNENAGATSDRNWVSLPWHSEYNTVQDLTNDLSPAGDPLTLITNLRDDQAYESWLYDELFGWYGTNFAITPGEAYEMVTTKDTLLMIVGSNNPDGLVVLNENAGSMSDRNWVSIPYNAAYSTVRWITTEYSPDGNPVNLITNMRDDQAYESWLYDDLFGWYGAEFSIQPGRGYEFVTIIDTTWNPTEYTNEAFRSLASKQQYLKTEIEQHIGYKDCGERMPVWTACAPSMSGPGKAVIDNTDAGNYALAPDAYKNVPPYREPGVSHIVFIEFEIKDCEDILFTAYRPEHVQDVLTEDVIGCGYVCRDNKIGIWFNTGNFRIPWKDAEEVIVIIEAFTTGNVLWNAITVNLDKGVDMQRLGTIELHPMPVLKTGDNDLSWTEIDHDLIIGYSVYKGTQRMNDEILTEARYPGNDEMVIRYVVKGGFETVNGIQSLDNALVPASYAFSMYPNPVVGEAHIQYALPAAAAVSIKIYDVAGKLTRTLVSERQEPGYYNVIWDSKDDRGREVSAGVYFTEMRTGDYISKHKVILFR